MSSRLRSWNSTKISFFAFQDIITSVSGILILVTLILATELDRPTSQAAPDADPELERQLSETLRQQVAADAQNQNLQGLVLAAETAPAAQKLESDITRLRDQLADEKKKNARLAEQLAASQSAIEARDRTLGLTDLKAQIQRVLDEVESITRRESAVRKEMATLEQHVGSVQSKLLKLREREGKLWLIPDRNSTSKEPILAVISAAGAKIEQFDHPAEIREFAESSAWTEFGSYLAHAKPRDQYIVFLVRPSGITLFGSLVKMAREKSFEVGFDALEEDKDVYFATPTIPDETTPPAGRTASQYQPGTGGYSDPRGGTGDIGSPRSGPAQKQAKASDADASQRAPGEGSSAYAGSAKGKPTAAPQPTPATVARNRTLWQRFVEWFGFSGSKAGSSHVGNADVRASGPSGAPSAHGAPAAEAGGPGGGTRGSAGGGSAQQPGSPAQQAGTGGNSPGGSAGSSRAPGTYKGTANGRGADSGVGTGNDSGQSDGAGTGAGNSKGPGVGKASNSAADGGVNSSADSRTGSAAGQPEGTTTAPGNTGGSTSAATNKAGDGARAAATNSVASADPNKRPAAHAAKPTSLSPLKPRSWWQRFVAWVASLFT